MRVTIVAAPRSHQVCQAANMADGFRRHGLRVEITHSHSSVKTDNVCCWGWRTGKLHRAAGRQVLVMERGYIGDRFFWTSMGWNGLNGRAKFFDPKDDGARFNKLFSNLLRPWIPAGEYSLLIGQVPGDAALQGKDLLPWYNERAAHLQRTYGLPVVFRPHPQALKRGVNHKIQGTIPNKGDLADAINKAMVVDTFNSNAGVESILAGKPTFTADIGAMARGVSNTLSEPDRLSWAGGLAWRQFSPNEMKSGLAWEMSRQAM